MYNIFYFMSRRFTLIPTLMCIMLANTDKPLLNRFCATIFVIYFLPSTACNYSRRHSDTNLLDPPLTGSLLVYYVKFFKGFC